MASKIVAGYVNGRVFMHLAQFVFLAFVIIDRKIIVSSVVPIKLPVSHNTSQKTGILSL